MISNAWRSASPSRISSAPASIGWYSHLCGSSVIESASSMPRSASAPRSVRQANPPYAASTCSHTPCSRQIRARSASGSTAPELVVPALATTTAGRRPAARSASIAPRSAEGRTRIRSSVGSTRTWSGRKPSTRAPRASEEWVWSDRYSTASSVIGPINVSRAHARAVRLAADPPETRTPLAVCG